MLQRDSLCQKHSYNKHFWQAESEHKNTRVIICNYMHDFLSQSEEKIDVLFTIATTIWEITEISNWENGVGSGWIFRMVLVIDCYVS